MFQNHLLQLLTLVAMEPPAAVDANALRDEKVKVLGSIREIPEELSARMTVRGQYDGYRKEHGVDPESSTETFAAIQLFLDNWRWHGVPFYLRSGKMLAEKSSEIVIAFRRPPMQMFDVFSGSTELITEPFAHRDPTQRRYPAPVHDEGAGRRDVDAGRGIGFLFP